MTIKTSSGLFKTIPLHGLAIALAATLLASCGGGDHSVPPTQAAPPQVAQPAPVQPFVPTYVSDTITYDASGAGSLTMAEAVERSARSQHEITLNGKRQTYVATAGHLNVSVADEDPRARMFYVAYTMNTGDANRPVTFFYNGGPGSSSIWLHLASYGPKRLQVDAPNYYSDANKDGTAPRFQMVDNQETLLATSDLVFVDAVSTGYSQAIHPKTNKNFWNTDEDAAAFRDFVIRYRAVSDRPTAPFYLAGESYGGPRTAILSRLLIERGHRPDGAVLISPILNYNSNCSKDKSVDGKLYISCLGFIPTYVAAAAHFRPELIPAGRTLAAFLEGEVVPYVEQTYHPALKEYMAARKAYNAIPPTSQAEKDAAKAVVNQAKVPLQAIAETLRTKYGVEIEREKGMPYNPKPIRIYEKGGMLPDKELGRYDARIAVPADSRWAVEGDPSSTLLGESYQEQIKQLLSSRLNYSASSEYTLRAKDEWTFEHAINGVSAVQNAQINQTDTIHDLKAALKLHPKMKIMAASGYADMATPFHLTKLDLDRLEGAERANLTIRNYEGGHMMYLTDVSRVLLKKDLENFYQQAPAD